MTNETADQRTAQIVAWLRREAWIDGVTTSMCRRIADAIEREFTTPEGAGEPTCLLGKMHGMASTFTDAAGQMCCDFCGQPVPPEPAVDPLVEALDRWFGVGVMRPKDVADCRAHLPAMIRAAPELIPADVKRGIVKDAVAAAHARQRDRLNVSFGFVTEAASKLWPDEGEEA